MKTYKAIKPEHLSENDEAIDLVNINDENDVIMAAPDNFQVGEILTEDQIEVKECNYVDEQGTGTAPFAFKILTDEQACEAQDSARYEDSLLYGGK